MSIKDFITSLAFWFPTHLFVLCTKVSNWLSLFFSDICQENSLEMSPDSCKAGDDFIVALFKLFSCLNNVPKALTQSLQPYLERSRMWEHLYTLAGKVATSCCIMLQNWSPDYRLTLTFGAAVLTYYALSASKPNVFFVLIENIHLHFIDTVLCIYFFLIVTQLCLAWITENECGLMIERH